MGGPRKTPQSSRTFAAALPVEQRLDKVLENISGKHGPELAANITRSSEAAGIDRTTVYTWRRDVPEFEARFQEAWQEGYDMMEEIAKKRAFSGFEEPVIYKGQISKVKDPTTGKMVPLTTTKFSDTLTVFLLKGNKADKFRDRVETIGGPPAGGRFSKLSDEELDAELKRRLG